MKAIVKYVHRVAPSDSDWSGPFPIDKKDLYDVEAARRWLRWRVNNYPRVKLARRTDEGGWVFFPPDRAGNWHSISIVPEKEE